MIPLKKLRELRERGRQRAERAAVCDSQECGGEICTAEDPRTCRVHGMARLEKEDFADKRKGKVDLSDAHCLRDIANSMSMKEADAEIAKHFSSVMTLKKAKELAKGSGAQSNAVRELADESLPIGEVETNQTKRCIAATLRYLHMKFPKCQLPTGMTLLLAKNRVAHKKGRTVCKVTDSDYSIGICFCWDEEASRGRCFGHGDYRNNFDYFRHELFHAMESEREIVGFYGRIVKAVGRETADAELLKVSKYAFERHGEAEAECFAKMTSSDYKDDMNETIAEIVKKDCEGGAQ